MARALGVLLAATLVLALLVSYLQRTPGTPTADANVLRQLREENERLRHEIRSIQSLRGASCDGCSGNTEIAIRSGSDAVTVGSDTGARSSGLLTQLLDVHSHWEWEAIAREMLQPFARISRRMVDDAVDECYKNGTMYFMRAQVIHGELYITDYRAVFFDRHYAPARVMPMLDVLRRHAIPDVDIVVAAVDEPRVKAVVDAQEWPRTVLKYRDGKVRM
jgi:hypothetical protein